MRRIWMLLTRLWRGSGKGCSERTRERKGKGKMGLHHQALRRGYEAEAMQHLPWVWDIWKH